MFTTVMVPLSGFATSNQAPSGDTSMRLFEVPAQAVPVIPSRAFPSSKKGANRKNISHLQARASTVSHDEKICQVQFEEPGVITLYPVRRMGAISHGAQA